MLKSASKMAEHYAMLRKLHKSGGNGGREMNKKQALQRDPILHQQGMLNFFFQSTF